MKKEIKVALIGYGGMARVHNVSYRRMQAEGFPVSLVAVCERDVERVRQKIVINLGVEDEPLDERVNVYADIDELLEKEDFDMADICLPTFLHKDYAIKLLRAGKHVLCEKPLALSSADAAEMIAVAKEEGRILMAAHCLRVEAAYICLREIVEKNTLGPLRYITMSRLSGYPRWGAHFNDIPRTGGNFLDMHIHDVDFLQHLYGMPRSVNCTVWENPPHAQLASSQLHYDGFSAMIEAIWDEAYQGFSDGYRATFEGGTAVYEEGRVTVYPNGTKSYHPHMQDDDYIGREVRAMAAAIWDTPDKSDILSPESVYHSLVLMEHLRKSADAGSKEIVL
ncbi:MAG: Gfo/Idh/MocA family oxidoreductase [Clostridia bacterium]|nr:Gfo/Idh/MocA family oxidoreductase [Clostridia bacterium]